MNRSKRHGGLATAFVMMAMWLTAESAPAQSHYEYQTGGVRRVPPVENPSYSARQINCQGDDPNAGVVAGPQRDAREIGGMPTLLPTIPPLSPRPNQGSAPDQQWNPGRGQAPMASFIESLKGNDAAIEVIVGQGKLLTLKEDLAKPEGAAVVAVGDPTVLDFEILPSPRMIRLIARRIGVTDLSITTVDGKTYAMEVHVVYDLKLIQAQLMQIFPDTYLRLGQMREHVVIEGQARNAGQVAQIVTTLRNYLRSAQVPSEVKSKEGQPAGGPPASEKPADKPADDAPEGPDGGDEEPLAGEGEGRPTTSATIRNPEIINLLRVPGSQQVLLKVRIAELNRTALREIGADILGVDPDTGTILGTNISSAAVTAMGTVGLGGLVGSASSTLGAESTAFGIFPRSDWEIIFRALRANAVLTVLAEPNLVAMSGHKAHFLAGGEFPIPVPQSNTGGGQTTTVEFREFGVRLNFVPYIMNEDRVRLSVMPEVSTVDFTLGTTLVVGGDPVPGLNTRRAATTVDLGQGETLAIAGLLQLETSGETQRIPLLGDLPYIGPLFSNTRHRRQEKELLVLVTPYLVQPMQPHQVGPLPGDEVRDPTDAEFYLKNRVHGQTGRDFRATTDYEIRRKQQLHRESYQYIHGPHGFSPSGPAFETAPTYEVAPGYEAAPAFPAAPTYELPPGGR